MPAVLMLQLKSISATALGCVKWTLLPCNPACEKLSSVCASNSLWTAFGFVPSTFLLDHGK